MEYTRVFPRILRTTIGLISYATPFIIVMPAKLLAQADEAAMAAASSSAQNVVLPVMVPAYLALMAGYVWLYGKIEGWPSLYWGSLRTPFICCGFLLLFGTIILSLSGPIGSDSWAVVGSIFILASPGYLFLGVLVLVKGWEAYREHDTQN